MEKAGSSKGSDTGGSAAASTSKAPLASPGRAKRPGSSSSKGTDEEHRRYEIGNEVLAIWNGTWHKGKVIRKDVGEHPETKTMVPCYCVHYPGFAKRYDEWLMADSLMLLNAENKAKADAENTEYQRQVALDPKNKAGSAKKIKINTATPKGKKGSAVKSEKAEEPSASLSVSGDDDAAPTPALQKVVETKPKAGRKGRPPGGTKAGSAVRDSVESSNAVAPVAAVTPLTVVKEEPESVFVAPAVSIPSVAPSDNRSESGVGEDEFAIEEEIKKPLRQARNDEDASVLLAAYEAFDPNNPKAKVEAGPKERIMYESLSSLGLIPAHPTDAHKTPEEKEAAFMRATKKLMLMKCAELRKAQDEAVMSIDIPTGLTHLMAENYIQTVLKEKLQKNITVPEKSFRAIIDRYIEYAEKTPAGFSFYQQKSRLAEAKALVENFPKMFHTIALRMEWPQWDDVKKKFKKDLSGAAAEYGLVHVVRAIRELQRTELMVDFFNLEGKRQVGVTRQKLTLIYEDMLRYLEEYEVKECDEGEAMYVIPEEEYVSRIVWISYEVDGLKDASVFPFQFLDDRFFQVLSTQPKTSDEALKLAWQLDKDAETRF